MRKLHVLNYNTEDIYTWVRFVIIQKKCIDNFMIQNIYILKVL